MAGAPKIKITAEDIAKTEKEIKSAAEISGTKAVAEALNKPIKIVEDILRKGLSTRAGQQIIKTVDNLDKKLLDLRAPKQTTPPSVPSEFAKEQIKPTGETGFQITGPTGGPLVPTTQTRNLPDTTAITPEVVSPRMQNVSQKLLPPGVQDAERVSTGLVPGGQVRPVEVSQEELAGLASKAKPGTPGQGVTERMTRNRPSLGDEFNASMGLDEVTGAPMSKVPKKAAGLGAAAAAAGAAGLASVGFSKVANAPVVIKEAAVDKPDDVAPLLEKAKENVEPGKQAALVQQAQQVTQVAKSIEELFKEVRDENRDKQARIELMKVTETIMHGLVTAIGANALLNRNSPFAVDFSQGPKTDWNSQFDRLQKQFDTQIGFLTEKYKIEEAGKRAVARETQRQAERKEDLAFKEKELAAKQQGQATSAAEAQEKKKETAIANATGIIEKISALDKEKDSQQLATARGQLYKQAKAILPKEELVQVEERAATLFNAEKSKWKEFFRSVGLASQEPSKKEYGQMTDAFARALNEKINPAPGFAGQAAPASDLEAKKKRMQELLAKQKGG
jgi:hypothetical protein